MWTDSCLLIHFLCLTESDLFKMFVSRNRAIKMKCQFTYMGLDLISSSSRDLFRDPLSVRSGCAIIVRLSLVHVLPVFVHACSGVFTSLCLYMHIHEQSSFDWQVPLSQWKPGAPRRQNQEHYCRDPALLGK